MTISDATISAILEKLSELAPLVLDSPPPASEPATVGIAVNTLLAELERRSAGSGLRGLAYIFRILHKLPLHWPGGTASEDDRSAFYAWSDELCSYLVGATADDAGNAVIEGLCRLPWMPALEPRLVELVRTALRSDAGLLLQATPSPIIPLPVASALAQPAQRQPDTSVGAEAAFATNTGPEHSRIIGSADKDAGRDTRAAGQPAATSTPAGNRALIGGDATGASPTAEDVHIAHDEPPLAAELRPEHAAFASSIAFGNDGARYDDSAFARRSHPNDNAFASDTIGNDGAGYDDSAFARRSPPDDNAFAGNDSEAGGEPAFAATTPPDDGAFAGSGMTSAEHEQPALAADMPADDSAIFVSGRNEAGNESAATVWISPQELGLIGDAVAAQLLPAVSVALDLQDAPTAQLREALEACTEQFALLQSALDALGLAPLLRACEHYAALLQRLLQAGHIGADDGQVLSLWPVLLIGHLQDPHDAAAAHDLIALLAEREHLSAADAGQLAATLTRVAIGTDPALRQQRKQLAESDDIALDIAADVLPSVRTGMLQELPGRCAEFTQRIHRYLHSRSAEDLDAACRIAHTLKGDSNMVGVRGIANLAHALEEILLVLAIRPDRAGGDLDDVLVDAADVLEAMSDRVLGRGPEPDGALALLQRVMDCANALQQEGETAVPEAAPAVASADIDAEPAAAAAAETDAVPTITLPMPLLDELLRLSGEAVIYARQVENRVDRVNRRHGEISVQGQALEALIAELQQLVEVRGAALNSLRLDLGEEFDALEMDRYNELHTITLRLVEASADTRTSAYELNQDVVELRELLAQQDRVQLDLGERVQRARTVPLAGLLPRLQRVVRQTSRQLGKPCELVITGEHTLLDQELLDGLAEPLLHLLRNAVDHGIEASGLRSAAGKPAQGRISLDFQRDADRIVVRCRDDGAGLDLDAIRHKALELGLLDPQHRYTAQELAEMIFHPGFSTRSRATLTSGRGIGMDIVRRRATELKGSVSLRSEPGRGCEFELRLPLSQVAAQVLLADCAGTRIAINLAGIQRMAVYEPAQLRGSAGRMLLHLPDEAPRAALPLAQLLGYASDTGTNGSSRHVLLTEDENQAGLAILVDQISDARSVIIKRLGPHVALNPGVRGATILGDGSVAIVIDLAQLLARRSQTEATAFANPVRGPAQQIPSVLIVDDSLSVRRSLEQVIGDAGFRVATARDGLEAVERVRSQRPDLMVIDLEMPRMNGLELTSYIRNEDSTRGIPIIMITSRTTERHRDLARAAGVDTILSKPYSEEGLLALIADKLARGRQAA